MVWKRVILGVVSFRKILGIVSYVVQSHLCLVAVDLIALNSEVVLS